MSKDIELTLKNGLDARAVAQFVQTASDYKSDIFVEYHEKKVNAKSIMGMMSLGAAKGEVLTLFAKGEDEEKAVMGIEAFLTTV